MRSIIVCVSIHHGNTRKIAEAISEVINAKIVEPKDIDVEILKEYDIIGFGSGIYAFKHHKSLLELAERLPKLKADAFIFSTSGTGSTVHHNALRKKLESKGIRIIGEFSCPGYDTFSLLKFFGGINKGRPNKEDLNKAKEFAKMLLKEIKYKK